jgi:hypothetical protein
MQGISPLPLEALRFEAMASGAISLVLTEKVSWDQFTNYADRILDLLDGRVRSRADSPAERSLGCDDSRAGVLASFFALGVSLDARDPDASAYLSTIRSNLERHRDSSGLSYDEIAETFDVPLGTVKSRMGELIVRLRKKMPPWTAM